VQSVQLYSNQPFVTLSLTFFEEHGIGAAALTRLNRFSESIHTFVGTIVMEPRLLVFRRKQEIESMAYQHRLATH
jgi:hypothetical protein